MASDAHDFSHAAMPANANFGGHSMEYWTGQWWTTLMKSPADDNMNLTGAQDTGKVTMLGGRAVSGTVTHDHLHVDAGDAILIPVVSFFDLEGPKLSSPGIDTPAEFVSELNVFNDRWATTIDEVSLTVDGKEVDLSPHFHRTGVFSMGKEPSDVFSFAEKLGVPQSTSMDYTMAEGYMVMLHPLSKGEHEIEWHAKTHSIPDANGNPTPGTFDLEITVTDHIVVA